VSPRPRTPEAPILHATIELLAEHGLAHLTVDDVAAAAGVSKATIYRRWPSRAQLIHAAMASLQQRVAEPDTGSLRGDLVALLSQLVAYLTTQDSGRILPSFIDAAARDPELAALLRATARDARLPYQRVITRGIERGELDGDLDVDLFIDLLMSPFIYRQHILRVPVRARDVEACVDLLLAGRTTIVG